MEANDTALVFPPTTYQEGGQTQTYRSRWTHSSADGYDVVTEFRRRRMDAGMDRVHAQGPRKKERCDDEVTDYARAALGVSAAL